MANFDILSRSEMVNIINHQTLDIKTVNDKIRSLTERMEDMENKFGTLSGKKRKQISECEYGVEKIESQNKDLVKRFEELQQERMAIIAFNSKNNALPFPERLKWSKTTLLSGGNKRVTSLTEVKDNTSLMALIDSEHLPVLCTASGSNVRFTKNIFKKSWVFINEDKLVPLCRDFKGGIGVEYLWTSDEEMKPPSDRWTKESKKDKDPRRKYYDPLTMKLWVPEESEESKGCEEEIVGNIVGDVIGGIIDNLSNLD
jgi:uncharacterized coiled-coil protein SlyX